MPAVATQEYSDDLGNWDSTTVDAATETRTHSDVNELTSYTPSGGSAISLTYDDAGNLTQDGDSDGDHKYTWDYRNRLIEVEEKQSGNWNTTAEYKYDGLNRRVRKIVTSKGDLNGTTRFLWGGDSGWQCLEERDSSGDLVARYTYSLEYIDAVAVQERDLNADDDFGDDDEVVYYLSNTLYSVYALVDGDENVVERYRYDAYGKVTVLDADGSVDADGLSDVENPYTFTGRRRDTETGLIHYRFRFYCPNTGRFLSRDPVLTANLYEYASGCPIAEVDSMGLLSERCWGIGHTKKRWETPVAMIGPVRPFARIDYSIDYYDCWKCCGDARRVKNRKLIFWASLKAGIETRTFGGSGDFAFFEFRVYAGLKLEVYGFASVGPISVKTDRCTGRDVCATAQARVGYGGSTSVGAAGSWRRRGGKWHVLDFTMIKGEVRGWWVVGFKCCPSSGCKPQPRKFCTDLRVYSQIRILRWKPRYTWYKLNTCHGEDELL